MNEIFSTQRTWLLLRSHVVGGYRSLVTLSMTLAGVLALLALLGDKSDGDFYANAFGWILIVLGVILSSRAFRALHDKTSNTLYLLTPASTFEKTLVPLGILSVGFFVYLLALISAVSIVVEPVNYLWLGYSRPWLNPFDPVLWQKLPGYLFLQSFYFLGAAWFRKSHFVKTTLSLLVVNVALGVIAVGVMRFVFAPYWGTSLDLDINFQDTFESFSGVVKSLVYGVCVLWVFTCWYVSWLRVREAQVCDGI